MKKTLLTQRLCIVVSTTMMTTETMLASSAPAASDTMLAIASGVRAVPAAAAKNQTRPAAAELQQRDQAGREVDRADVRAVAELQHRGDQVDDDRREELPLSGGAPGCSMSP